MYLPLALDELTIEHIVVTAVNGACVIAASWIGHRAGRRSAKPDDDNPEGEVDRYA